MDLHHHHKWSTNIEKKTSATRFYDTGTTDRAVKNLVKKIYKLKQKQTLTDKEKYKLKEANDRLKKKLDPTTNYSWKLLV